MTKQECGKEEESLKEVWLTSFLFSSSTNQGGGETKDSEKRSGGSVGHIAIIPRFLAQLHVGARDVIR